jgi:hypothetical protein
MKNIFLFQIVILISVTSQFVNAQNNCSLPNWSYFRGVEINNILNANSLNQFQLRINVDTQTPISQGKMQANGDDIRFLSSSCNSLNYWIESGINTTNTTIWVKVDYIQSNSLDSIFMYYGNPIATGISNGDSTFILFDNFNDNLISSEWSVLSGSWMENNGVIQCSGDGTYDYPRIQSVNLNSLSDFYCQYNFRWTIPPISTAGAWHGIQFNSNPSVETDIRSSSEYYLTSTNSGTLFQTSWPADDTWHKQVISKSNDSWGVFLDNFLMGNGIETINTLDTLILRGPSNGWGFNSSIEIDNLFLAKHSQSITYNVLGENNANNCQLFITIEPTNQNVNLNNAAQFIILSSDSSASYQWQTDIGLGFQDITNAGQYSGSDNDTLIVSMVSNSNNNQLFRCIIYSGICSDTSDVVMLTVNNNVGIQNLLYDNLLSIYPNPTKNSIHLIVNQENIGSCFQINDFNGKTLLEGIINEHMTIDISHLNRGVYFFGFGKEFKTYKVIKD